ncbi:MAG: hypothetical protein N2V78_12240 [Methanophagales archaeon]|nr:hypothetical protein [Methanophagales archaeon]
MEKYKFRHTPEKGQPYYEEATNRLKELIEGKNHYVRKKYQVTDLAFKIRIL